MKIYQIDVAWPIGPVARSTLPAFTARVIPIATVLAGTVENSRALLRVLALLEQHGLCPLDVWVPVPRTPSDGGPDQGA